MRYRTLALLPFLALLAGQAFASTSINSDLKDNLHEDGHGIIANYANMHEGDDIDWVWVAPNTKLADHRCRLASFKDMTHKLEHHAVRSVMKDDLPRALKRACSHAKGASQLRVDVALYHIEHANAGKAWIPFTGGHLAQAEACMEFVFKDSHGKVQAKIRHCAREGGRVSAAADEVLDDLGDFIRDH